MLIQNVWPITVITYVTSYVIRYVIAYFTVQIQVSKNIVSSITFFEVMFVNHLVVKCF